MFANLVYANIVDASLVSASFPWHGKFLLAWANLMNANFMSVNLVFANFARPSLINICANSESRIHNILTLFIT